MSKNLSFTSHGELTGSGIEYIKKCRPLQNETDVLKIIQKLLLQETVKMKRIKKFNNQKLQATYLCSGPAPFLYDLQESDSFLYNLLTRHLNLALVDLSENFTRFNKIQYPQFKSVVADATRYGNQIQDQALIILNSSYHHIPDNNKKEFLENIFQNLKIGGRVIMGENFLPKYKSSNDRVLSVQKYYKKLLIFYHSILEEMPKQDIIDRKNLTDSIDLIKEVKKRDLNRYGEFKTDLKTFIDILPKGFEILEISQVWPLKQTIKISQTVQIPNNYYGSGVLLLEKK